MTAPGRFGPFVLLSLALHAAAVAALRPDRPPAQRATPPEPAGLALLWEAEATPSVGAAPAPPAVPGLAPPPPPAALPRPPAAPPVLAAPPPPPPLPDIPPSVTFPLPEAAAPSIAALAIPPAPPAPRESPLPAGGAASPAPARPASAPRSPPRRAPAAAEGPGEAAGGPPGALGRALGPLAPPEPDSAFRNAAPPYPEAARRRGEQGAVLLELAIGTDGRVMAVQVVRSSGSPILDEAARRAALDWRFRPARQDGVPVPATARTTVHFRLE